MRSIAQYDLRTLFQFTSLCGILLAFAPTVGVLVSVGLILLATALATHQGWVAIVSLAFATFALDVSIDGMQTGTPYRHLVFMALASGVLWWYFSRRFQR
jgi:hypothetical protein